MHDAIDLYCERTDPGFWAEPVNALSNLSILLAVALVWRNMASADRADVLNRLVLFLAACIAPGSFVFHTVATGWTQLADTIPIWSFVAVCAAVTIYRLCRGDRRCALVFSLAVLLTGLLVFWLISVRLITHTTGDMPINGSLQYLPAILVLLALSVVLQAVQHPLRKSVQLASGVFLLALGFRSLDLVACRYASVGTHFVWHALVALTLFLLLNGLLRKAAYSD